VRSFVCPVAEEQPEADGFSREIDGRDRAAFGEELVHHPRSNAAVCPCDEETRFCHGRPRRVS
jgi:hypothetical protein